MPKLGMGPIRREQICRAAAAVISSRGFDGTTMRMVAEEAGVSTGMLNHYFSNRMEMLEETLLFVSQRQQARETDAIDGLGPESIGCGSSSTACCRPIRRARRRGGCGSRPTARRSRCPTCAA